ncbi:MULTISPECIES: O-antigen ligase family protein [unclassified Sinorhizobium]|uniref:O-antigen ligase family protein n=1 Tax=unclassified Sinorhizobium TaxID=2613772 RepID=UPI003523AB77
MILVARISKLRILTIVFIAIVLLSVLSFGSAKPFALSLLTAAMAALFLVTVFSVKTGTATQRCLLLVSVILILALGWSLFQTANVSVQDADTIYASLFFSFPAITFMTGLILGEKVRNARFIIKFLAVPASLMGVACLAEFLISSDFVLGQQKLFYKDSFTLTFVNRNNAGTFLGLTSLILMRQFWASCRNVPSLNLARTLFLWQRPDRSTLIALLYAGLTLLTIIGLFLTKSRGAIGASFVAMFILVVWLLWLRLRRQATGRQLKVKFVGAAVVIAATMLVAFIFAGERVMLRADTIGTRDPRFCTLPAIVRMLEDNWQFGTGAGTFVHAFPRYRDPQCGISGIWEKAHNSYLQFWIEFGLLAPILTITCILLAAFAFVRHLGSGRSSRSYSALALCAGLLVALHAIVDFSIEIPGIASFFAAIMAACSAIALADGTRPIRKSVDYSAALLLNSRLR